jgi:hypothetical protein
MRVFHPSTARCWFQWTILQALRNDLRAAMSDIHADLRDINARLTSIEHHQAGSYLDSARQGSVFTARQRARPISRVGPLSRVTLTRKLARPSSPHG